MGIGDKSQVVASYEAFSGELLPGYYVPQVITIHQVFKEFYILLWLCMRERISSVILKKLKKHRNNGFSQKGKGGWEELGDWDWCLYTTDALYKIDC